MPADTMGEMILGFAVIIGVLLAYRVTLMIRARAALLRRHQHSVK